MLDVSRSKFVLGVTWVLYEKLRPLESVAYPEGYLDKLLSSIKTNGFIVPFLVLPSMDEYKIIDGLARYWAVNKNPPNEVPVVFVSGDICDSPKILRQLNKYRCSYKGK